MRIAGVQPAIGRAAPAWIARTLSADTQRRRRLRRQRKLSDHQNPIMRWYEPSLLYTVTYH